MSKTKKSKGLEIEATRRQKSHFKEKTSGWVLSAMALYGVFTIFRIATAPSLSGYIKGETLALIAQKAKFDKLIELQDPQFEADRIVFIRSTFDPVKEPKSEK